MGADITYIQLSKEFVYLAVIIDVFSRRCIGWELSHHIDTGLTLNALHKAFRTRNVDNLKGMVHHSDQGVQYASKEYVDCLKEHDIQISMSRTGNPYDNHYASYCTSSILSVTFIILEWKVVLLCFSHLMNASP
jgi:transposase InsO family protein